MTRDSDIMNWTKEDFMKVPFRKAWDEDFECDSIIIIPTENIHDSDFACMDFIAMKGNDAVCRLSGCSDVIHINGIGGYGYKWFEKGSINTLVPAIGWCIDCLPKSGLLRLFTHNRLIAGSALSSFEIFAKPKDK